MYSPLAEPYFSRIRKSETPMYVLYNLEDDQAQEQEQEGEPVGGREKPRSLGNTSTAVGRLNSSHSSSRK